MDGLRHYPKAIIPDCMQLGTNSIRKDLGWGREDSDKFSKRFLKTVGVERYSSVAEHICIRPQVQTPATARTHTHTNPVSEDK